MKKMLKVILIIGLIIVAVITSGVIYITSGLKSGQNLELSGIEPSKISDGTYAGKYTAGRWTNELSVTVKSGLITDIKLNQDVTFADQKMTEELFNRVIKEQNTTVDAVSGATVSSKAYLKAIENALNQQ
jgi:uncharacterized protein with FMN-binding domain